MKALIAVAFLLAPLAWATSYTANIVNLHGVNACGTIIIQGPSQAVSGNWDTPSTWTPSGTPTLSDTCTITGWYFVYDGSTITSLDWNTMTANGGTSGPTQPSIDTRSTMNRVLSSGVYPLTLTAHGLSTSQGMVTVNNAGSPTYSVWNHIWYAELFPGVGRVITHVGTSGVTDQSVEEIAYSHVHNGSDVVNVQGLGDIEIHNLLVDGTPTGAVVNNTANGTRTAITYTITGSIGNSAVTLTTALALGSVPGQLVAGTGIAVGTTVAAASTYAGSSTTTATLSVPPVTGFVSGETITIYAEGNITDNTVAGNTCSTCYVIVNDSVGGGAAFYESGNAYDADPTGVKSQGLTNSFLLAADNLMLSRDTTVCYPASCVTGVGGSAYSSTVNPPTLSHTAIDGAYQDTKCTNTMVIDRSFFGQWGAQSVAGQGALEQQGSAQPCTITKNVFINYADPGAETFLFLNNSTSTNPAPAPDFEQNTFIMLGTPPTDTTCLACLGETSLGQSNPVIGAKFANNLIYDNTANKSFGLQCRDAASTFATDGPLGAGVYGNRVFALGWTTAPYVKSGPCTGFDNGTLTHPNAAYSDSSSNPQFGSFPATGIAAWIACDASLTGHAGTEANIFTAEMGKRYQYNFVPDYTARQFVDCLRAMATPADKSLANGGYRGAQVGALLPTGAGPTSAPLF